MRLNIFFLLLFFLCSSFTKNEKGNFRIKLIEYDLTFVPDKCKGMITKVDKKKSRYYKLYLKDCKGTMLFESFDLQDSTLKERGSYIASLDLLKSYIYAINATTGKSEVKVSKYYQPLKDGTWYFYGDEGNKIKAKEIYKRGVLISKE